MNSSEKSRFLAEIYGIRIGISAASIYRILTENLGYIKVCAKFVPHTLKPHEKDLRIQHSTDIIKEAKKNRNFYFGKLHLAMKGKRYADVDTIQKALTAILNAIPKDDLKESFDYLLDRANRCNQCEFRRRPIKCLQKKINFLFFL